MVNDLSKYWNFNFHHLTTDPALKRDHLLQVLKLLGIEKRKIVILTKDHMTAHYLSCILNIRLKLKSASIHKLKSEKENVQIINDFCNGKWDILITSRAEITLKNSLEVTDMINYDFLVRDSLYFILYYSPREIFHQYIA
jgi:hypothetical protein